MRKMSLVFLVCIGITVSGFADCQCKKGKPKANPPKAIEQSLVS